MHFDITIDKNIYILFDIFAVRFLLLFSLRPGKKCLDIQFDLFKASTHSKDSRERILKDKVVDLEKNLKYFE